MPTKVKQGNASASKRSTATKTKTASKKATMTPNEPSKADKPAAADSASAERKVSKKGRTPSASQPAGTKSLVGGREGRSSARSAGAVEKKGIMPSRPAVSETGSFVLNTRRALGVTQDLFARMIGASARSVATWEAGGPINQMALRGVLEMARLAVSLREAMNPRYIPTWLTSPNESMGGMSPVQALEHGENDRVWESVFFMGSGLPV